MAVTIREYGRIAESHSGKATVLARGVLITDELGLPIKTVVPVLGGVDSQPLTGKTHFVELENTGAAAVYYAVRPKGRTTTLTATTRHRAIQAGDVVIESVHPQCIINVTL
jgi:hypothetical protein